MLWAGVVVCRVQQQQPLQQMLTQNFAVHNWNSTSHYQPYSQPATAPVDPGQLLPSLQPVTSTTFAHCHTCDFIEQLCRGCAGTVMCCEKMTMTG